MPQTSADIELGSSRRSLPFSPRTLYRALSIAEAATWTLLIAGMLLKYVAQAGDLGVQVGGFLHGLVFLAYAMTAVLVGVNQRWSVGLIAVALVTAVVPYATIPFDRWLERRDRLEGEWRSVATDDPRDRRPLDVLLRWMLNHPRLLVILFVVALALTMTTLLVIGPPGRG